ncbi:MAG: hypothetical protein HW390_2349 [Candidatus Brocadiaceae bacterium]|nr:hypothetical protein [Candidatus Brocadiaceae bacterium]
MPCLLPIIVRAKAHSVVITNPSLKAGVNRWMFEQSVTASIHEPVHHEPQPKGLGVMAGGLAHKRGARHTPNPGFSPDGTQLGILHDSLMLLSNGPPRFPNNAKPRALPWAVVLRPFGAMLFIPLARYTTFFPLP